MDTENLVRIISFYSIFKIREGSFITFCRWDIFCICITFIPTGFVNGLFKSLTVKFDFSTFRLNRIVDRIFPKLAVMDISKVVAKFTLNLIDSFLLCGDWDGGIRGPFEANTGIRWSSGPTPEFAGRPKESIRLRLVPHNPTVRIRGPS